MACRSPPQMQTRCKLEGHALRMISARVSCLRGLRSDNTRRFFIFGRISFSASAISPLRTAYQNDVVLKRLEFNTPIGDCSRVAILLTLAFYARCGFYARSQFSSVLFVQAEN